jgi:tetratricopeptide (TPR) repeat protein
MIFGFIGSRSLVSMSFQHRPSVDDQRLAVDPAAALAAQHQRDLGDLGGGDETALRGHLLERLPGLADRTPGLVGDPIDRRLAHVGVDPTRANPNFGKPFNSLGTLYISWDKLPEAVKVLENGSVNVIDPLEKSDVFYHLGFAYEKQNNLDKAVGAYNEALQLQKGNIDALRQRGITFYKLKKLKEADKDLDAFIKSGGGGNAFQLQAANQIRQQIAMKR